MITSDPDDPGLTHGFSDAIRFTMELTGFVFGDYTIGFIVGSLFAFLNNFVPS